MVFGNFIIFHNIEMKTMLFVCFAWLIIRLWYLEYMSLMEITFLSWVEIFQ